MECRKRNSSTRSSACRSARSPLDRPTKNPRRGALDLAHGRTLERPAGALWKISNRTSPFSELGALRRFRTGALGRGPGFEGSGRPGPAGMFHRWHVRPGQKRGRCVGKTKRGKGSKIMALSDGSSSPLSVHTESASPHELTLVGPTLERRFLKEKPERLIGDKAYDSDPLDAALLDEGIEMIAPHRRNRKKEKTQDGRKLRRYKRRWKVERLFAWLQNFRRLVVRYEYKDENFLGMAQLGCIVILLRKCL